MNLDDVTKGRRAEKILNDDVFQEAMKNAEESLKDEWKNDTTQQGREACWHKLHALSEVKRALRVFVNHKDYAERQQEKRDGKPR